VGIPIWITHGWAIIMKILRFLKMGKEKYKEQLGIAYHEAGHSVIGYLHGHKTKFIDINLDLKNNIYPHVDKSFGADELIIKEISELDLLSLSQYPHAKLLSVSKVYCIGLLAGTFAELWYLYNSHPESFEKINKNDKERVRQCINVIYKIIGNSFDRVEFVNECLNQARDLVCDVSNFSKIEQIARLIICSKNLRIEQHEIEKII
jgi:hypothetical protein